MPSVSLISDVCELSELRNTVALLGARPFLQSVVQSPWNNVPDVESLHRDVKENILHLLRRCGEAEAQRCLTIIAAPGYGKTHLLAWTRAQLDAKDNTVFVFIPPWKPEGPNSLSAEQHLMRATIDAIWSRSPRQQRWFQDGVRKLLVQSYDGLVDSRTGIRQILKIGTFWQRCGLGRSRLKIGGRSLEHQTASLQRAFSCRDFLDHAFAEFCQRPMISADGVRPDRDAFVAAALRVCGDTSQTWHADRWFSGERIPPNVWQPFHLDHPCETLSKVRNGLLTLQRLVGRSFCFAFDQLEATYHALENLGPEGIVKLSQWSELLRCLCETPGVGMLCTAQFSSWGGVNIPPMLRMRMLAGYGPQQLQQLTPETAQALIGERLKRAIWERMPNATPPTEYFPFTDIIIKNMLKNATGGLRQFLELAEREFQKWVITPPRPQPFSLTQIEPSAVLSHERTAILIRGENLPENVRVAFGDLPAVDAVCRPVEGEIEATAPAGLRGDVQVRVEDAADAENWAIIALRYADRTPSKPYCNSLSGAKFRKQRLALGLIQKEVAKRIGVHVNTIGNIELEKQAGRTDENYEKLATCYDKPLHFFLRGEGDDT